LQMRSDVTVASCLSGGMDSSALVCVAASQSPYRLRTFTARYTDRAMDEWAYAQSVATQVPIDMTQVFVEPKQFWADLPEVLWHQEEPFAGPNMYAQWVLMRTIRASGVKVTLDGQGGDEVLCGYAKYFFFALRDMWHTRQFGPLLQSAALAVFNGGAHLLNWNGALRYMPGRLNHFGTTLLQPDFARRQQGRIVQRPAGDVREQQILDIERYSLPVLLRYEDKHSMAHSVEARVPFLDHRLVELAVNLPTQDKLHGAQAKYVMRRALGDLMPQAVLRRRTKLGFGGTFTAWLRDLESDFQRWLETPGLAIERYVSRSALRQQLTARDPALFRPLVLEQWLKRFGYSD
jgi:asparagine synthase (glutamine-hydrolysing)